VSSVLQLPILGGYGYNGQEIHQTAGLSLAGPPGLCHPICTLLYCIVHTLHTHTDRAAAIPETRGALLLLFAPSAGFTCPSNHRNNFSRTAQRKEHLYPRIPVSYLQYIQYCTHGLRVWI